MGLLTAWFAILFAGVLMLLLGPLLHYWVVKKLVVFKKPRLKKCFLFFVTWLGISSVYGWLAGLALEGAASNFQEVMDMNKQIGNFGLLVTLTAQTLLGRWIFEESYLKAFKASVVYIILLALLTAVLLIIGLFSGLELFNALVK